MLHIPPTNLLLLAAKQEPYKKAYLLAKNIEEFSGKSSEEWTSRQNTKDRKSNRTRQKNRRGDSEAESNDSPEIPDRGQTSDIPGLRSGVHFIDTNVLHRHISQNAHSTVVHAAQLHQTHTPHKMQSYTACI